MIIVVIVNVLDASRVIGGSDRAILGQNDRSNWKLRRSKCFNSAGWDS